jgi:hypothetical protein
MLPPLFDMRNPRMELGKRCILEALQGKSACSRDLSVADCCFFFLKIGAAEMVKYQKYSSHEVFVKVVKSAV